MTMKIRVTNEDAARVVEVSQMVRGRDATVFTTEDRRRIEPGKSDVFYIHAAKHLVVEELPNG